MSRRKDRGFLDGMELWSPRPVSPTAAPSAYVLIARTFEQLDRVMLDEMQEDIERCSPLSKDSSQPRTRTSRFSDMRSHKDSESYVEDAKKGNSHTSSKKDTLANLTDTKCLTAWSWVHRAILEYQGGSDVSYRVGWIEAKARANQILNLALAVLEAYDSDQRQNLQESGHEGVDTGIEAKLRTLLLFDSIYSRQAIEEAKKELFPRPHTFTSSFERFLLYRKDNSKFARKEKYARAHQNVSNRSG